MKSLSVESLNAELKELEEAREEAVGMCNNAEATLRKVDGAIIFCKKLLADLSEEASIEESDSNHGEVVPFQGAASPGD